MLVCRFSFSHVKLLNVFITLLLIGLLASCEKQPSSPPVPTYNQEVAKFDITLQSILKRIKKQKNSWIVFEQLAQTYLQRARLTRDYQDYTLAQKALQKAFRLSGKSGPFLTQAQLKYSLHQLDTLESDLTALENRTFIDQKKNNALLSLRANLAYQLGKYDEAFVGFQQIFDTGKPNLGSAFQLANFYAQTGHFEKAEPLLKLAEESYHGLWIYPLAWLRLHHGMMAFNQGHFEQALAYYYQADNTLKGWWLVEEQIAGMYTLQGKIEEAKALYQKLITKTGKPEFMDALAQIALFESNQTEAFKWIDKARRIYDNRLKQFPEATYGHALAHFLYFENDANVVVKMAERNRNLRPNGEALIMLAKAYLKANRVEEAKKTIEQVVQSPYTSVELYAVVAQIYDLVENQVLAKISREKALALDPYAMKRFSIYSPGGFLKARRKLGQGSFKINF